MSASPEVSIEAYLEEPISSESLDDILDKDFDDLFHNLPEEDLHENELEFSLETDIKKTKYPSLLNDENSTPHSERDQETLFRELVQENQKRLYRFVIRYIDQPDDAADITQQAFVEAARTIDCFRGESKLSTWLYGIAMNMVRNYLSRSPHRIYRFESDDILGGLACTEPDPSDSFEQREMLALVEGAFSGLPSEMREVLSLVAIDEISYQDAAEILAIPLGTVRSRVSRARAVLRTHFLQAGVSIKF
ncbi:MAG: RNA polymerase sigma factor [Oxalobacteraceae bacterium]|jgi:RNA polymerase sigma factor (sigma-70 family)|nr:RNA polymerase sigma factor [Oxalobacteraceae bacterium]